MPKFSLNKSICTEIKDIKGREKEKKRKFKLKARTKAPFGILNSNIIYLYTLDLKMLG
jgi:hypothetical protein